MLEHGDGVFLDGILGFGWLASGFFVMVIVILSKTYVWSYFHLSTSESAIPIGFVMRK